ncbi:MAG: DUF3618 domain-containing protein [Chloroflexi bacterium]|jgi:hypothetical protein|nr:MAG: DUF3618 domain-containing protein [Chloroflexota bacterium]
MSDQDTTSSAGAAANPRDPEAIREEIDRTREDMGETLDALGAKLDVKAQAKAKADQAKTQAKATADHAKVQAQTLVSQGKEQAQVVYRRQPKAVIVGAGAVLAIIAGLLVRRARR